jgi:hypothetical protein
MSNLYQWLFHYNHYSEKWNAFKREDYVDVFNGKKKPLASSSINTLIEIVEKTEGDVSKLKIENRK